LVVQTQSQIVVEGSAFIYGNISIALQGSTSSGIAPIQVDGAVTIAGATLVLSGPSLTQTSTSFTIATFSTLINGSVFSEVEYESPVECEEYTVTQVPQPLRIEVLITLDSSRCNEQVGLPGWGIAIIAVGSVAVVAGVICAILFGNPKIRQRIMPYRGTVN
jgi:hypothetical protein